MEREVNRSLSKGLKVALWLVLVWLLFCVLGAFGNNWYSLIIVCIVLIAAILCLFKGILDAKYGWTVFAVSLILPFVIIGALASPDDVTVQKQEDVRDNHSKEADKSKKIEKTTKEQTEKAEKKQESELSPKEKKVAEAGANQGALFGMAGASNEEFSNMLDVADYVEGMDDKVDEIFKEMAGGEYDKQYGSPTNAEEKKLKKIYIEHFIKAMNNTMDGMDALEKLGGKR